jgi:PAS domain S-box-containing protein
MKIGWNNNLYFLLTIIFILSIIKAVVLLFFYNECMIVQGIEHIFTILFIPFFLYFIWKSFSDRKYSKELNKILISQSQNSLFYHGEVKEGAKLLTKKVAEALNVDRCSIWLYNKNKNSIICQQLYISSEDNWYSDLELNKRDAIEYFENLEVNPIIVANNAETHIATACLKNKYLIPVGVKSMLDVAITHKGNVIGVICIESKSERTWKEIEISFAQILSSLYAFAHTVKENKKLSKDLFEFEKFVSSSVLVSKADKKGKITYVNKKFQEVSGFTSKESLGKNHNIVNSGEHDKSFWEDMYDTTIKKKKIWNNIITNKNKNGELYWVDSYIKADFEDDNHIGFTSIRYDVTELQSKEIEIRNRMNAINKSNCVIEFDLDGNIIYANDLFLGAMGYNSVYEGGLKEIVGKHHSIFVDEEYKNSEEYNNFWDRLKRGMHVSEEFKRIKKNGEIIWLQASYNPIISSNGDVYKIMKIAQDITKMVEQRQEIDNKNTYLEHAAKIIRHDLHSGINTYIPRGVNSLERRLTYQQMEDLKILAPFKMIKEGLIHTQKVYKGVYQFTNLVKKDAFLEVTNCDLKLILENYLNSVSYKSQIQIFPLIEIEVNESLFCTAIDNLIRNGLKYNDSNTKMIWIQMEDDLLIIQDNGRGMTQEDFKKFSKPYVRKEGQKESGTGLGLNISVAILNEHGFEMTCEKNNIGTKIKIKIK